MVYVSHIHQPRNNTSTKIYFAEAYQMKKETIPHTNLKPVKAAD